MGRGRRDRANNGAERNGDGSIFADGVGIGAGVSKNTSGDAISANRTPQ